MRVAHALTLVHARSCLAALADRAHSVEGASAYERVLIYLDQIHGDETPAIEPCHDELTRALLFTHASVALARLREHGIDELQIELALAGLSDAYDLDET